MSDYIPVPGVPDHIRRSQADIARAGRAKPTAIQALASAINGSKGGRPKGVKDSKPRKKAVRKRRDE